MSLTFFCKQPWSLSWLCADDSKDTLCFTCGVHKGSMSYVKCSNSIILQQPSQPLSSSSVSAHIEIYKKYSSFSHSNNPRFVFTGLSLNVTLTCFYQLFSQRHCHITVTSIYYLCQDSMKKNKSCWWSCSLAAAWLLDLFSDGMGLIF